MWEKLGFLVLYFSLVQSSDSVDKSNPALNFDLNGVTNRILTKKFGCMYFLKETYIYRSRFYTTEIVHYSIAWINDFKKKGLDYFLKFGKNLSVFDE